MYTHFKTPFLQIENYEVDDKQVMLLPEEINRSLQVIIVDVVQSRVGKIISLGMVRPDQKEAIKKLEKKLNATIRVFEIDIQEWAKALNGVYERYSNGDLQTCYYAKV